MGVLNITQRSSRLVNIGDVRMARTDDGSVQAAERIASASRRFHQSRIAAAEANGKLDQQYGQFISQIGGLVGKGAELIEKIQDEEDARNLDEYSNKFQERMLAHNQGNGKDVLGAMNETIPESDRGQWMEANGSAAKKIHESVLKDMDLAEEDFKDSRMQKWRDSFLFKQNAQWLSKRNSAMTAYADKEAEKRYENDRNDVTDDMVSEDGWKNISASMDRLIERKGWGPEQAKAFRRKEGETICGIGIKKAIDATTAEAVLSGVDGGSCFDGLIKSWDGSMDESSFLPPASWIVEDDGRGHVTNRNPLKEWLTGADMKSLKEAAIKDAKAAKAGWEAGMRKHTKESFVNAQNDILAIPAPEDGDELGQKNYQREVADAYRRLIAKDPRVLSGRGDEWVRDDLKKFAPDKVAIALRAIKGAEDKADVARVRANGQIFLRSFTVGVPDPMVAGGRRQLTTAEKNNLTEFLYTNGEISHEDYARAMKMVSAETTPVAQKFLSMISEGMNGKFPKVCEWQDRLMAYRFKDTNEAKELAKEETGIESSYQSDTNEEMNERLLFNEYADFASLVMQKMVATGPKQGESEGDMLLRAKDEFDKLTRGTNEGIYRLSVKRRQEAYRRNVDAIVNTNRNRINVAEGLPRGMELSRQTQAAQGGASGGQRKRKEEK